MAQNIYYNKARNIQIRYFSSFEISKIINLNGEVECQWQISSNETCFRIPVDASKDNVTVTVEATAAAAAEAAAAGVGLFRSHNGNI